MNNRGRVARRGLTFVVMTLVGVGCSGSPTTSSPAASGSGDLIPQASVVGLDVADPSARVDLRMPTFTNPTEITNPLFPVAQGWSGLLVGQVGGQAFRTEITVLPGVRVVEWGGQRVETVVSQYAAFLNGRLHELTYDQYAQADDGSVWYFGEDVFNFSGGSISDTHGTWHAGVEGPAGMIMPANPQVGQVYRPENVPGLVFEEVTVRETGRTLDGPFGSIEGGVIMHELHLGGSTEDKTFAPGYGEFFTDDGGDIEALAMAIPVDLLDGDMPEAVRTLADAAIAAFDAARDGDVGDAIGHADDARTAHDQLGDDDVATLIRPVLADAVAALADAASARDAGAIMRAAVNVARLAGDLQLRWVAVGEVDRSRIARWADQLLIDARAGDLGGTRGDLFALDYTQERTVGFLDSASQTALDTALEELHVASGAEDFDAIVELAGRVRQIADGSAG
jgi:hypothetical protein